MFFLQFLPEIDEDVVRRHVHGVITPLRGIIGTLGGIPDFLRSHHVTLHLRQSLLVRRDTDEKVLSLRHEPVPVGDGGLQLLQPRDFFGQYAVQFAIRSHGIQSILLFVQATDFILFFAQVILCRIQGPFCIRLALFQRLGPGRLFLQLCLKIGNVMIKFTEVAQFYDGPVGTVVQVLPTLPLLKPGVERTHVDFSTADVFVPEGQVGEQNRELAGQFHRLLPRVFQIPPLTPDILQALAFRDRAVPVLEHGPGLQIVRTAHDRFQFGFLRR